MTDLDPGETASADLDEAYLDMKLSPADTGLPMAVWITANEGFPHDVRIKVSLLRGGKGRWSDAVPVSLRPQPRDIADKLSAADFRLVCRWLDLNRQAIIDYWNQDVSAREIWSLLKSL
jgi:hypothetical protein